MRRIQHSAGQIIASAGPPETRTMLDLCNSAGLRGAPRPQLAARDLAQTFGER